MSDDTVIATRILTVEGRKRPAVVAIYAPRQVSEDEWACALSLALQAIRVHLDEAATQYIWLAEPGNHGFEPTIPIDFDMDFARRMTRLLEQETTRFVRRSVLLRRQRRNR
ncbi:MAG: hypothetical protein RIM84_26040 [Alphaproteobacteria bacterium]